MSSDTTPAWLKYLRSQDAKLSGSVPSAQRQRNILQTYGAQKLDYDTSYLNPIDPNARVIPDTLAKAQKQSATSELAAAGLGVDSSGQVSKGFVSKALDVLTFLPSVLSSGVKEFIYDPAMQYVYAVQDNYLTPEERAIAERTREKVSLDEFRKNVAERNFSQEMYGFLNYTSDAPLWEKALKEAAGFGIDIAATGGTGGGFRLGTAVGRKVATKTLGNAAEDSFARLATRAAGETDAAFAARGRDFAARVATSSLTGRSRAVAKEFETEFGKDLGKQAFKELPSDVRGGLRIGLPGATVGNINSGGYVTDAVASALGLSNLPKATEWAVRGYQNTKNILRADAVKNPIVAAAVGKVNSLLNNIGMESNTWQAFVKAAVDEAADKDIAVAYRSFADGVDAIRNLRNIRGAVVEDTNNLFKEIMRVRKMDEAAYNKAIELMKSPATIDAFTPANPSDVFALNTAKALRDDYNRYHELLKDAGFDVGYLQDYLPLLYVQGKDQSKLAEALAAGPKNLPGRGYDPTKARKEWMKDKFDPATGETIKVPMTPSEIKEQLIRTGRKDAAELIEEDPLVLLARYSTNVSRLIATKNIMDDLVEKGVLLRSDTPQIGVDQARLQEILADLRPKDLDDVMKKFLAEPEAMGNYMEALNNDLAKAYQLGDEAMKADVNARIETLLNSMQTLGVKLKNTGNRLNTAMKKAEAAGDSAAVANIKEQIAKTKAQREYLRFERASLGQPTGVAGQPSILAQQLPGREGVEFVPVGAGGAVETAFYLPEELAGLHGTKELVDTIERTLLLRNNDKKAQSEVMKSLDQYMQFFRTGATFGRLTGFVLRNGYGAVQNNYIIAGSTWADHKVAKDIAKTRIYTEFGLKPFTQLTRADKSRGRLEKLAAQGRLTPDQVERLGKDIDDYGFVQTKTVNDLTDEIMQNVLSERQVVDGITQWDVYTAGKEAGIYDKYVVLPASQGLDAEDAAVSFLNNDPDKIVVRTDKMGRERSWTQRAMEGVLNVGTEISADVAGRTIKLRPVQVTRDLNQVMEELVRLAPIATGLRKYGNTAGGRQSAGMLMKAAQFDYSNLTDVERRIFRRVLPFYTYSRNNVPSQMRALMNDPERIRRNLAAWDAVGNVFTDENGDTYVLPDYIGQMHGFLIDDNLRKKIMKNKPAWLQAVLANPLAFRPETPVLELERWTRGGTGPGGLLPLGEQNFQEIIGSANPMAKAIAQVALGENLFSGQKYSAEGVPAPAWIKGLDTFLRTMTGGAVDFGVRKSDKTGQDVVDQKVLDVFTTLIPQIGTLDRTAFPMIELTLKAATGKDVDLSKYDDRTLSNLLSQFGGVNIATITPQSETSELYDRVKRRKDNIAKVAGDYGIDRQKLYDLTNNLYAQNLSREEIIARIEEARAQGLLAPDPVSANPQ